MAGGKVLLSEGDFQITSSITRTDGGHLWLAGSGAARRYGRGGTVISRLANVDMIDFAVTEADPGGFMLSDFMLDGNRGVPWSGRGIYIHGADLTHRAMGWTIENVRVKDCRGALTPVHNGAGSALALEYCGWHRLINCFFAGTADDVAYIDNAIDFIWIATEFDTVQDDTNPQTKDAVHFVAPGGSNQGQLVGCHIESGDAYGRFGIAANDATKLLIGDCNFEHCGVGGIAQLENWAGLQINNCRFFDINMSDTPDANGGVGVFIGGDSSRNSIIEDNLFQNWHADYFMYYGVYEDTVNDDYNLIQGNRFRKDGDGETLLGVRRAGLNTIVRDNMGHVTENSGTATITNPATSVVVAHGLAVTPTVDDITVTLAENPTADPGNIWVDTIGAANFTINCRNAPGVSDLDLAWKAVVL